MLRHYPGLDVGPIIAANPGGADGVQVMPKSFFDVVLEYAQSTEEACHFKQFIE